MPANSIQRYFFLMVILLSLFSCESPKPQPPLESQKKEEAESTISYWDQQRKGTNYFNELPTEAWFDAAVAANIKLVRLVFEKWAGEQRDFILGDADNYQGIVEADFQKLLYFLNYAATLDIKIVICPISIPGSRWRQSNGGQKDGRQWTSWDFRPQVIQYWKDLAGKLRGHPAVVGYNLVNEPHPEIYHQKYSFWQSELPQWYETIEGSPADLNLFNRQLVEAIREVDTDMPIVVESGLYATPWAFDYLKPLEDERIIYSFHMYEPYQFTTKRINQGQFTYPDTLFIEDLGRDFHLTEQGLDNFFEPIRQWSQKHQIPRERIWVGEFGCNRHIDGVGDYLRDLIAIFNDHQWHWAFYAYREDTWEAMDYELGTDKVHYTYWAYQDSSALHLHYDHIYKKSQPLWEVIRGEFLK